MKLHKRPVFVTFRVRFVDRFCNPNLEIRNSSVLPVHIDETDAARGNGIRVV